MPVVPITSACNLDCPICYTVNKNDDAHMLSKESFAAILDHLVERARRARHHQLHRRRADAAPASCPSSCEMCARRPASAASPSPPTASSCSTRTTCGSSPRSTRASCCRSTRSTTEIDKTLLGANTVKTKLKVLDLLEKHDVTTTILPAVAAGLNDHDVGPLLELVLRAPEHLLARAAHADLHRAGRRRLRALGAHHDPRSAPPSSRRRPAGASAGATSCRRRSRTRTATRSATCSCSTAAGYVPFTRFMTSRATLFELLARLALHRAAREAGGGASATSIDDLWADPDRAARERGACCATLKRLIERDVPAGRPLSILDARRRSPSARRKAIYIHSHMDEETFDVARIMKCCVGVPEADGTQHPDLLVQRALPREGPALRRPDDARAHGTRGAARTQRAACPPK